MGLFSGDKKETNANTTVSTDSSVRIGNLGLTGDDAYKLSKTIGQANVAALQLVTQQEAAFLSTIGNMNRPATIIQAASPSVNSNLLFYGFIAVTVYFFFVRK